MEFRHAIDSSAFLMFSFLDIVQFSAKRRTKDINEGHSQAWAGWFLNIKSLSPCVMTWVSTRSHVKQHMSY